MLRAPEKIGEFDIDLDTSTAPGMVPWAPDALSRVAAEALFLVEQGLTTEGVELEGFDGHDHRRASVSAELPHHAAVDLAVDGVTGMQRSWLRMAEGRAAETTSIEPPAATQLRATGSTDTVEPA